MRKTALILTCVALAASAQAAVELSYSTQGDNTIVTAADGGTTYWEMTVDTASTAPGRIMAFYDLSGASSDTYNYAHTYALGVGLIDPGDNGGLRTGGKWTISNIVTGTTEMTYTLSRDLTKDTGAATYSMDFTIGVPTITAGGYDTNIHVVDTFAYDANWVGASGEARIRASTRLNCTADNDEYTFETHNGVTEGAPANLSVEATVTDADSDMAAGSTFTSTLTYTLFDTAYDTASGTWEEQSTPYARLYTDLGISGNWAGNPGPAGSARSYSATMDLDIAIVPEPATMSLLTLGGLAILKRRRR